MGRQNGTPRPCTVAAQCQLQRSSPRVEFGHPSDYHGAKLPTRALPVPNKEKEKLSPRFCSIVNKDTLAADHEALLQLELKQERSCLEARLAVAEMERDRLLKFINETKAGIVKSNIGNREAILRMNNYNSQSRIVAGMLNEVKEEMGKLKVSAVKEPKPAGNLKSIGEVVTGGDENKATFHGTPSPKCSSKGFPQKGLHNLPASSKEGKNEEAAAASDAPQKACTDFKDAHVNLYRQSEPPGLAPGGSVLTARQESQNGSLLWYTTQPDPVLPANAHLCSAKTPMQPAEKLQRKGPGLTAEKLPPHPIAVSLDAEAPQSGSNISRSSRKRADWDTGKTKQPEGPRQGTGSNRQLRDGTIGTSQVIQEQNNEVDADVESVARCALRKESYGSAVCFQEKCGYKIISKEVYVYLTCSEKCNIFFHKACWKEVERLQKEMDRTWKLKRGVECLTDGCSGMLRYSTMQEGPRAAPRDVKVLVQPDEGRAAAAEEPRREKARHLKAKKRDKKAVKGKPSKPLEPEADAAEELDIKTLDSRDLFLLWNASKGSNGQHPAAALCPVSLLVSGHKLSYRDTQQQGKRIIKKYI